MALHKKPLFWRESFAMGSAFPTHGFQALADPDKQASSAARHDNGVRLHLRRSERAHQQSRLRLGLTLACCTEVISP